MKVAALANLAALSTFGAALSIAASSASAVAAPPAAHPAPRALPHPGAAPTQAHPPAHPAPPVAWPLPFLPTIARVSLDQVGPRLLVTEDVRLPRGEWTGGDIDLYIAFGAPGFPRAIDAHLFSAATGDVQNITLTRAPRCPNSAHLLLGPRDMTGVVAHLGAFSFKNATASGDAVLRIRSVLDVPAADEGGAREVLVRLGAVEGEPLGVERVELGAGLGTLSEASVHLCGEEADPYPLAVTVAPPSRLPVHYPRPAAPWLVTRHASDSLCIDWTK